MTKTLQEQFFEGMGWFQTLSGENGPYWFNPNKEIQGDLPDPHSPEYLPTFGPFCVERWFVDVLGYTNEDDGNRFSRVVGGEEVWYFDDLPDILNHWPSFVEFVVKPVRERGYRYVVSCGYFYWRPKVGAVTEEHQTTIHDDRLTHAAIEAGLQIGGEE